MMVRGLASGSGAVSQEAEYMAKGRYCQQEYLISRPSVDVARCVSIFDRLVTGTQEPRFHRGRSVICDRPFCHLPAR